MYINGGEIVRRSTSADVHDISMTKARIIAHFDARASKLTSAHMQQRARKPCGSLLPNKRRGCEQYVLGQYDTVQSTTSAAVVVLFLTVCIGPCQCQTEVCGAGAEATMFPIVSCSGVCPCPAAAAQYNGQIRSNTGSKYVNNANCIWTVVSDTLISLYFSGTFVLEENYDFVKIWTCTSASCTQSTMFVNSHGDRAPSISTTSNVFRVQFTSDRSTSDTGFVLNWNTMQECTLCAAGKYKITTGNAVCTNCLANQYSTAVAATSNVCQGCGATLQSPAGSSSCICNAGTQGGGGGVCTLCVAGKYKIPD